MQEHAFVIPAYKDSSYLEDCIQSLMNQKVKSEIVLTTSTPSPFIEGLAKKYGLKYCVNDKPSSIAGDWNFALAQTNTKLVTIAHQDDIYDPLYTESILNELHQRGENNLIVFTGYEDLINGEVRKSSLNSLIKSALLWPFFFSKNIKNSFFKKSILLFGDPICCPTVTLNLAATPTFKFSTEYTCALDWLPGYSSLNRKDHLYILTRNLFNIEYTSNLRPQIRLTTEEDNKKNGNYSK